MCSWPSNVEENSSSTTLAKHVLINFLGKISYHTTKKQSFLFFLISQKKKKTHTHTHTHTQRFHIWTLDVNKVTVKESYGKGTDPC